MAGRKRTRALREVKLDPGKLADRPDSRSGDAAAVLRWWLEAGVEFAIDETPRDHFVQGGRPTPEPPSPAVPVGTPMERPILPGHRAAAEGDRSPAEISAGGLAATAPDLATLRARLEAFEGCGLK